MLVTPLTVEFLADRIERAYLCRHPEFQPTAADVRVWAAAGWSLVSVHRRQAWIPIDPELFVASQVRPGVPADPWADLAPPASIQRYRKRVRQIIVQLRRELRAEIRKAESLLRQGCPCDELVTGRGRWFSPLGRYIVAVRHDRAELVERVRMQARHQHHSCPLYREAARPWLSPQSYPVIEILPGLVMNPRMGLDFASVSLN